MNELEMHLTEFCIDEDDKFGIHVWWKQEDSILSTLVKDIFVTTTFIVLGSA
jgi:hypothetical protein